MKLSVEVIEAKYPRKSSQYAVWVNDDDKKEPFNRFFCARPYTSYKVEAELVAEVFRQFIANGGEQKIIDAKNEMP